MAHMSTSEQLARINPDSKPVLHLVLAVTTVIAAVAFAVSFAGLAAVSQWAQIPPRLSWALPVFIDGAILGFTIMILVFRARGESTIFAWVVLIAFTLISVAANGAHAYAEGHPGDWRTILGSGLAGLAPAGLAVFIHGIARLLVTSPKIDKSGPALAHLGIHLKDDAVSKHRRPTRTHGRALPQARESNANNQSSMPKLAPVSPFMEVEGDLSQDHGSRDYRTPRTGNGTRVFANDNKSKNRLRVKAVHPRKAQIDQAVELYGEGMTQKEIGDLLGVSRATVGRWIKTRRDS